MVRPRTTGDDVGAGAAAWLRRPAETDPSIGGPDVAGDLAPGIVEVLDEVGAQVAAGDKRIVGVMIESNLVAGRQDLIPGKPLTYGQSITDKCMDWATTLELLTL